MLRYGQSYLSNRKSEIAKVTYQPGPIWQTVGKQLRSAKPHEKYPSFDCLRVMSWTALLILSLLILLSQTLGSRAFNYNVIGAKRGGGRSLKAGQCFVVVGFRPEFRVARVR